MNKIFKVIWSKSRNCYVVASELAKGHTKASSTGDKTRRLALAAITALMLLPVGGYSYAADATTTVTDTNNTQQTVYTTDGADNTFVKKGSDNGNSLTIGASESTTYSTHQFVTGAQTTYDGLNGQVVTQATGDQSSISLKVGNSGDLTYNFQNYSEVKTTREEGTTFTYHYQDGAQTIDNNTNIKGNTVTTGSVDASNGVVDGTTQDGTSVKSSNTVGQNLNALDTQVKANTNQFTTDKTSTALHISSSGNLIVGTKENQTVKDMKIRGELTSGSISTGDITSSGNVSVAGKVEAEAVYDDTTKTGNYVVQTNSVGANLSALDTQVKSNADAIEEEARKRKYSVTNLENADTQLQTNIDNEAAARAAADTELNERITNEANAIHETTNQLQTDLTTETDERKAADTALDTRITNVKEYLEKQTSDNYVSKTDAAVEDGAIVKKANTIGENVALLDKGLADETAARLGADAAQDKVIKQVNDNLVSSVDTINKNMAAGFNALSQADANELAGRVAADTKLAEAVNGGLSLSDNNVLQKNTTKVNSDGTVSTSKEAATTLVMNEGKENQITLSENGIKVGTNSSVMDANGVYTGGDDYDAAKAALKSDGSIKGANGAFTVDENGNVTSKATITGETVTDGKGASMSNGTVTGKTLTDGIATITNGNINTSGTITGGTVTSTGNISAVGDIHAGGAITGASASIQGALTAGSATITGALTAGGAIQGKSISDGTATMQNGNLTGVKDLSAETITTSGDATIGGDLTVNGKLNVDEIDLTKNGIVGDDNVTASTKVAAGEITSYKKATSTKDGSEKESSIDYDENGTSTWAKATDADGNWKKSTLTVEGSDVTSKVVDSDKNSNESKQTSTESSDVVKDADGNTSTFSQRVKDILQEIKNAAGNTLTKVEQTDTAITSQIGDGSAVKSEMTADGITNTAAGGTITNSAKDLVNQATGDMTNTVGGKMLNDVTGDMENKVGGNLTTTVGGNETHTVGGTLTETVTGKATENYNGGLETTITGEEKHTVNGTQTNNITGDQTNTIGGNQTTTVTGDSSLTAENITNEAKNKITNKALDVETDASSSIVNKVSNDAGSNTSTQLSYQTTEEMSQADGKKASYLRGAAEEKSQLTDGDKKTTIDTIAGQTNTNITDGTNTSNNLQKADQIASSVTDGTNTTVVNQKAGSLASSITDGTKANNTNNTVDKSEQLIKASDTQYSATSKTATKMEDALVSGSSIIDVIKNLDDAANPLISSAVTDGTNTTGVTQTATDITNAAKNGTIANDAKNIINNAAENMTNTVGKDLTTTVGGEMKTTVTGKTTENYNGGLETTITGEEKHTVNGSQTNNITGNQTTTVTGDSSLSAKNITNTASETLSNSAKNITNTATEKLSNSETDIENTASNSILNQVGVNTSWKMTDGQVVESIKGTDGQTNTTTTTADDTYQSVRNGNNVLAKRTSSTNDNLNITDGTNTYTKITTAAGNKQTVTDGTETASTNLTKSASNTYITNGTQTVTNHIAADTTNTVMNEGSNGSRQEQTASQILNRVTDGTDTSEVKQTASEVATSAKDITNTASEKITNQIGDGSAVKSEMTADGITNTAEGGTIYNKSKDILNEASGDILNFADGEIGNVATKITNITGDNTVTSDTNGTTFENKAHNTAIKEGTVTKTTISGNTIETGQATMDYADVMKDLGVHGNATVEKDLTVKGTTTTDRLVVNNGATVTGGTTTDKLHVTSTSTFDGAATFKDAVTMEKDLSVSGNATVAGSMTASSYKVGDKTYIDSNGINANNQKVVNVAPGRIAADSTDAVNGSQLYQTNERVTGVENKVNKLDSRVDKVGANAAALANLHPLEFDADSKWNIAAAVGGYKGETATAIGAFYRPNENVMINVSSSFGTGENMYGGGISLRIGQGGNKARRNATNGLTEREKVMQQQINSLTNRLDALLSVINPNMSKEFPDVPENHWAYEAVSRLAGNGVIQGYEDGKYHGERTMTRYEMAEIIYNALSKGAKAEKKLVEEFKPELQAMAAQKKA